MADISFPWSSKLAVAEIPEAGLHRDLKASAAECAALAGVAEVRSISGLEASFDVLPDRHGHFHVTGSIKGTVGQTCVVTLDPIDNAIDEPVDITFAPESEVEAALASLPDVDSDEQVPDPPEAIRGGKIDLGALAGELFVLAIDPYPRKEGAQFQPVVAPVDPEDHPFAALAALKGREQPK